MYEVKISFLKKNGSSDSLFTTDAKTIADATIQAARELFTEDFGDTIGITMTVLPVKK